MPNKCHGCEKEAVTKKGWCSIQCYRYNQAKVVVNKSWFKKGSKLSQEARNKISESNREWHEKNPERSKYIVSKLNTEEANLKKGHKGKEHSLWISDRTKVKAKRCHKEELDFFKKILEDRNYKCELTGKKSNKLSVHHIDSVHLYPEKKYDESNVIVILKDIHMDFHKKHGFQWANKEKWNLYLKESNYAIT